MGLESISGSLFLICVHRQTHSGFQDEFSQKWAELQTEPFLGTVLCGDNDSDESDFWKTGGNQFNIESIKRKRNAHSIIFTVCDSVIYSSGGWFSRLLSSVPSTVPIARRDDFSDGWKGRRKARAGREGITHFAYPSTMRTLRTGERLDGASAFPWRSTGRPARRGGAARTWRPPPTQSSRPSTGRDCSSWPSTRRPPCTDRPASSGCTTSGRRRSTACSPDSPGPFHSAGNSCQN